MMGSADAETRRSDTISLRQPLDIPLLLSGNFGELRRNHFHSGIDFKTQGSIGHKVFAVDDGYVSRVSVSPWGFGRAVYITHPATGLTTVYGHLDSFSPEIDNKVRDLQYEKESFSIDVYFEPGEISVSRGSVIALSGNSGSSGGPHLHFDVRDASTENPLDPLEYYRKQIKDNVAPEVRQLAIYPINGGVINNDTKAVYRQPDGTLSFTAWGDIVPGIKAYDRMTGTQNIYGVKYLTLLQDGDTIYHRHIDRYSFDDTRAIHTIINNKDLIENNSWIMTTNVADSNPLPYMINAKNKGIITINEERPYIFTWILGDEHGNSTRKEFTVTGKKKLISSPVAKGQLALWDADNLIESEDIYVEIPEGALYDNTFFEIYNDTSFPLINTSSKTLLNKRYNSKIVRIGDKHIPLAKGVTLSIPVENDTLSNKQQYCLVCLNGVKPVAVTSTYSDGLITGQLYNCGDYAVTVDNTPPLIQPVDKARWRSSGNIKFKISDNLSGIQSWRGEIDGKFALFELDGKTGTLSLNIKKNSGYVPEKPGKISLIVTDACGNTSSFAGAI